jgi:hypothetical protein
MDAESTTSASVREARLKPEFAAEYSGIEPGVWSSAAGLAERLITRLLREGVPDEDLPQRVLNPAHFEFRGGDRPVTKAEPGR